MSENKTLQPGDPQDPLASLHRMSTTAGSASQEYVAINLAAVTAFVLGLASALVLMSNVLLVIPIAAVAFGIVALKHISGSNGTQTGRSMALVGVLVALGLVTFVGVREYKAYAARQTELAVIDQLVAQLEEKVRAKDMPGVLSLFSAEFLASRDISATKFQTIMAPVVNNPVYGDVKSLTTNGRVVLGTKNADTGAQDAGTMLVVTFSKDPRPLRLETMFHKSNGRWTIVNIPQLFPAPAPPGGPGGPPPPGQQGPGIGIPGM